MDVFGTGFGRIELTKHGQEASIGLLMFGESVAAGIERSQPKPLEPRNLDQLFAGACLDWTERKAHLNGALGAAMTARLLGLGWIERGSRRRAVRVTPAGREGLAATFGWSLEG